MWGIMEILGTIVVCIIIMFIGYRCLLPYCNRREQANELKRRNFSSWQHGEITKCFKCHHRNAVKNIFTFLSDTSMAHKTFLPKPLNQLLSEIRPTLSFGHLSLIFMNDSSKLKSNYFSVSFYSNHLFSLGPCFIGTKESTDHLKIRKTICKKTR